MLSNDAFRKLALSFDEALEAPHHQVRGFTVRKRVFATLNEPERRCCIRLSPRDQAMFSEYNPQVVWPVPNAWGKNGWTLVNLRKVKKELLMAMLRLSYIRVAPAKLATRYTEEDEGREWGQGICAKHK